MSDIKTTTYYIKSSAEIHATMKQKFIAFRIKLEECVRMGI